MRDILKKYSFTPLKANDAIYQNIKTGNIIALYVDNFIFIGLNKIRL